MVTDQLNDKARSNYTHHLLNMARLVIQSTTFVWLISAFDCFANSVSINFIAVSVLYRVLYSVILNHTFDSSIPTRLRFES